MLPLEPQAEVVTETGARFLASVANLATTGLFLKTEQPLRFGQRLSLRLFGVSARGEVLFVSADPCGVVIGLRASPTALATLEAYRNRFETVGATPLEDLWAEDTSDGAEPHTIEIAVATGATGARPPYVDAPTPLELPLDPELVAAAAIDDSGATPIVDAWEGLATAADIPVLSPIDDNSTPRMAERPPLQLVGEFEELTEGVELPRLEDDGFTVRFASMFAYQAQFSSHLNHGGLVVLGEALPVGAQRMLSLVVPDVGTYTVSGRVIFHTAGRLGFILDSFGVHKEKLAAMATAG